MFDKAMKKSIEPYMEQGEELLNVTIVQGKGMTKALLAGGVVGQAVVGARRDKKFQSEKAEGAIELSSKMGIGITSRRLLLFKAGGAMALSAKELLSAVPMADVDSIELGKGMMTKPITITVRGESFQVEAPKASNTNAMMDAFTRAKGAVPA